MGTWAKLKSGGWGVRVEGAAKAGQQVSATTAAGKTTVVTISQVVWAGNGVSLCAIASASRQGSYRSIGDRTQERMSRTGWTGCSCGSIEGSPRASDCFSCRHDSE